MSDKGSADILRLEDITRRYREGEGQLEVFTGLALAVKPGEIVALVGPSGAGKSSLLHIAGLLEAPTSGEIYIEGVAVSRLSDTERTIIRCESGKVISNGVALQVKRKLIGCSEGV